ncbi:MAG TPA: HAD hydrolase-like protein [Thermohalobaculum sp.]|nr:HAD hydrolase-like protein [Thermohalobaculum sp.]
MRQAVNGQARGAIFDLDGTLADTAADLMAAANAMLGPRGLPLLEPARDRVYAGRGGRSMIRRSLSLLPEALPEPEVAALADALYPGLLRCYEARLAEETRLYDGVVPCLELLAADGWRLGVCTNKPVGLALALLERLGVRERFAAVLGAGSLPVIKPDPEHLRETVRRAGAALGRSVMLGDTRADLLAARGAGMPCVLMRFGFAAEPLDELAPDAVIDHYDEVAPLLERLCPRPAETA